jgi:hypothetical protein
MKINRPPSMIALAIYLILIGVLSIFGINLGVLSMITPVLALVAGVLILMGK